MPKKKKQYKPTRKNAIPTPLTRGIGPFYPIKKAVPFSGTILRQQINGEASSRHEVTMLGSPHFRFLLAANNLLFKNHYPNEMSRFDTTIYNLCIEMGIPPNGQNYRRVKGLLADWQQLVFGATMPYKGKPFQFGQIMMINFELRNWTPNSRIHVIFNRPYLEAILENHAVYFNMQFLSQFTDGYSPLIYGFIQGQKDFYTNKIAKVFKNTLEEVLGLPYMGLTSVQLRDARKAIHHSVMVTLRKRGYFHDLKDHGHFYSVTADWQHTADGSKKHKVPQPQPQVAAAVPTDNLTNAGKVIKEWWESKAGVIEAMGDKEAAYNKVGYWLDTFINKMGSKINPSGIEGMHMAKTLLYGAETLEEKKRASNMYRWAILREVDRLLEDQQSDRVPTIGWVNQERFWFSDLIGYFINVGSLSAYQLGSRRASL